MKDQNRHPGHIQRLTQNSRPKIQSGEDGNTNIILPGQTYVGNSRNKNPSRSNAQGQTIQNISDLPYSNLEMKNRTSQSRNSGVSGANTQNPQMHAYNFQDKNKKSQKIAQPSNSGKQKFTQNYKERSASALTMHGSAEIVKSNSIANRQVHNSSAQDHAGMQPGHGISAYNKQASSAVQSRSNFKPSNTSSNINGNHHNNFNHSKSQIHMASGASPVKQSQTHVNHFESRNKSHSTINTHSGKNANQGGKVQLQLLNSQNSQSIQMLAHGSNKVHQEALIQQQ